MIVYANNCIPWVSIICGDFLLPDIGDTILFAKDKNISHILAWPTDLYLCWLRTEDLRYT